MDSDSWSARLSSASKRYQSALLSRSEMFMGFDEIDGDDEIREEFQCSFCSEYFDIVGLCCHIDEEHPIEAKNGVCPVCAMTVGGDMVMHITLQHRNILLDIMWNNTSMQRKRRLRKGGSQTTSSILRKELRDGNLQSLFGGSSQTVSLSNAAPDPLLTSFIMPMAEDYVSVQPHLAESSSTKKSSNDCTSERKSVQPSTLSVKDKEEKAKRCEFVEGLLLSSIFSEDF